MFCVVFLFVCVSPNFLSKILSTTLLSPGASGFSLSELALI